MLRHALLAFVVLLSSGCAIIEELNGTREQRQKDFDAAFAAQPPEKQELIRKRTIQVGMTSTQVRLSWGNPREVNRTVGVYGTHEQWIYGDITAGLRYVTFVYFDDNVCSGWQDNGR